MDTSNRERVQELLSRIRAKREADLKRWNFNESEALDMFLENKSLRDIAHYYRVGHMTVALHLRRAYGRYITNAQVTSCYRSLVRDYLPYKYSDSPSRRALFTKTQKWAKAEMLKHVREFSDNKKDIRFVKDAIANVELYKSRLTEYYVTQYEVWGDAPRFATSDTSPTYLESIPSKQAEYNEPLRLEYFILITDVIAGVLMECLDQRSLSA